MCDCYLFARFAQLQIRGHHPIASIPLLFILFLMYVLMHYLICVTIMAAYVRCTSCWAYAYRPECIKLIITDMTMLTAQILIDCACEYRIAHREQ